MFSIQEIKTQLPHGAIKEIAKKSGIGYCTVSKVFNGERKTNKLPEILKATAEYLAEYKAKEKAALQEITEAMETPEQLTERLNRQREKYGENVSPLL